MSEGFWLFTLKMAVQSLRNRDSTFRGFQPNVSTGKQAEAEVVPSSSLVEVEVEVEVGVEVGFVQQCTILYSHALSCTALYWYGHVQLCTAAMYSFVQPCTILCNHVHLVFVYSLNRPTLFFIASKSIQLCTALYSHVQLCTIHLQYCTTMYIQLVFFYSMNIPTLLL